MELIDDDINPSFWAQNIIDVLKLYNWNTEPIPSMVKGGGIGERFLSVMHKDKKNLPKKQ